VLCFAGGPLAGAGKMPAHKFAAYNLAGITLWATTHIAGAYLLSGILGNLLTHPHA
jgi:membrane protein DedA with SNARE-associated domain